jgi:type II secretory pathway pseudopilin PulG
MKTFTKSLKARKQAGLTGIELTVVLAVVGILAVAGLRYFGLIGGSNATTNASSIISSVTKIKECFSTQSNFSTVSLESVTNAGCRAITDNVTAGPPVVALNNFSLPRSIAPANFSGGTNNAFTWTEIVPAENCRQTVQSMWTVAVAISAKASSGSAVNVKTVAGESFDGKLTAVGTACGETGDSTIVFTVTKGQG